jgi:hypothetical protein
VCESILFKFFKKNMTILTSCTPLNILTLIVTTKLIVTISFKKNKKKSNSHLEVIRTQFCWDKYLG